MSEQIKLYVWQLSNGEYIKDHNRFPSIFGKWGRKIEYTTTDKLSAKSYKTQKGSQRSLDKALLDYKDKLAGQKTRYDDLCVNDPHAYRLNSVKDAIRKLKLNLDVLKDCTVTEIEVDADAKKKPRIRFKNDNENGYRSSDYSGFKGHEKGTSGNSYCRICGMILAGLPYFTIGSGWKKSLTVCPLCLLERANEANTMLDKMDQELRKEIENERFIKQLG